LKSVGALQRLETGRYRFDDEDALGAVITALMTELAAHPDVIVDKPPSRKR
jgi:hypothetical protein